VARLVVEFWRLNPVLALGLTEAQWFGVLMIIVGLWQLVRAPRHVKVSTA
jgi:prolipoprotein diacylglyceryltransferase